MTAAPRPDAIVVGGGAIGCAVALGLAREGVSVTLLERGELAGEASGAAAGMLTLLGEGHESPAFLRAGLRSLALFPPLLAELRELSSVDPEHRACGVLRVAADAAEEQVLRARLAALAGVEVAWLDAAQARELEPSLAPGLGGALHAPREANLRSPLLVRALAEAAARRGARIETGVTVTGLIREGARIAGVETASGRRTAGVVVLCAGSFTPALVAAAAPDVELPIVPVRGQIVALDAPRPAPRGVVWGAGVYLVPKRDGSLVVGATEEHVGFDRRVTAAGVRTLLDAAERLMPELADASFRTAWAGLRPATPDRLPIVGPVPGLEGLVVAAGHFRNGVMLAPVTAELVRDGVLGKGWAEPAFLPERWLRGAGGA